MIHEQVQALPGRAALANALRDGEFRMCYQPQLSCKTLRIAGAEALMRWDSVQTRRAVSPAHFIPLAEESGYIVELGDWSLASVFRQIKSWQRAAPLPAGFRMAVNLSGRQMTPQLPRRVASLMDEMEVDPAWLEFEITESYRPKDMALLADVATQLRRMGAGIAIDDFGTGFSVMEYLRLIPATSVKIDCSLTRQIVACERDRLIMRNLLQMIADLGMESVCEGVETTEQLAAICEMGADYWQGFLFSPAVSSADFLSLLTKSAAER
ncbi:EAL domain-containing protein [Chromobacterium vaccinii]|uniref:EAL domain-containing protein n=1 Tax=Chromobacterium vaccinii TaxID=1108595 RepID=UPI0022AC7288|nr:EAL domain-containing protein [Chromobacterium vaccinii]